MNIAQSPAFKDSNDIPFLLPTGNVLTVDLPLPISVNRIWRANKAGKKRVSISPEYANWKRHADMLVMSMGALRGVRRIHGKFEARIVIQRTPGDLDNRIKGVLDWAQSRELIDDDKFCERITAEWGEAPTGCRLTLREVGA